LLFQPNSILIRADKAESETAMKTTIDLAPSLNFLDELRQHNNKAWFDQHRPAYELARETFERFIDSLIDEFRASDQLQGLSAPDCIFRINRDVRFAKDKSPYKTNLGAMIASGGRKSTRLGYYISIEPHGQSLIAGGWYMPESQQLAKFRRAVDRDASELKKIMRAKAFVTYFESIEGEKLKTAPQGYAKDHPEIELLRLKQITVMHHVSDQDVLVPDFRRKTLAMCHAMRPFLDYLDGLP
jgi:uncharacterized protein (TIGR02453 family)